MHTAPQLQDRIHAEIVLGCEADHCNATFIASEPACEPIEAWANRAATEASTLRWSISKDGLCFCPMHEPLSSKVRRAATSLLTGEASFLETVRTLSALRFEASADGHDPDFLLFLGIDSQTDHLPTPATRLHCTAEWLAKCDEDEEKTATRYKPAVEDACRRLIKRFSL